MELLEIVTVGEGAEMANIPLSTLRYQAPIQVRKGQARLTPVGYILNRRTVFELAHDLPADADVNIRAVCETTGKLVTSDENVDILTFGTSVTAKPGENLGQFQGTGIGWATDANDPAYAVTLVLRQDSTIVAFPRLHTKQAR
jgi:hypothetical protein